MIYEYLYVVAVEGLLVTGIVLGALVWVWYRHRWWEMVDWVEEANDRAFYWVMDKLMGKHETH